MAAPQWVLDPARNEYYYFSAEEKCYVYQSGAKLDLRGRKVQPTSLSAQTISAYDQDSPSISDASYPAKSNGPRGPTIDVPNSRFNHLNIQDVAADNVVAGYRVQPATFFKAGRVFGLEVLVTRSDKRISIAYSNALNGQFSGEMRQFVVVRENKNHCTCLSITNSSETEVANMDTLGSNHSIIYTRSLPPEPSEIDMRSPIKVVPNSRSVELDNSSQIDYSRVYTVEHNVKVYEFGKVAPEDMAKFLQNFDNVFNSKEDNDYEDDDNEDEEEGYKAYSSYRETSNENSRTKSKGKRR